MSTPEDKLAPENSPNKTGVRRVNNVPLIIIVSILSIFIVILLMAIMKRSGKQAATHKADVIAHHTDTSSLAQQVIGNRKSGIVLAPSNNANNKIAVPVAQVDNLNAPPLPPRMQKPEAQIDPELASIQKARFQAFEEAVKAKTAVSIQRQQSSYPANSSHEKDSQNNSSSSNSEDMNTLYQQKLERIHNRLNGDGSGEGDVLLQNNADTNNIKQFNGAGQKNRWQLDSQMQSPATSYELRAGAVIPCMMISGINSDLPGQIMGQVSQNVYDTATGKYLLIPQGTRLVGTYSSHVIYGQSAVLVAWQRLVFPDGKAYDIGAMPGGDSAGYSGLRDQVNNHYLRIFGSAFLISGIVAGIAYSQDKNNNAKEMFARPTMSSEMSQALGQQFGQATAQMISKNLNIAPTLEIRPGYRFNILVTKDMVFVKPYQSFDY